MIVPGLFRLPRHQQYHIGPLYYDPVKEDIAKRKIRIKKQLMREQATEEEHDLDDVRMNISEAFARKRKAQSSAGFLQFFMMSLFLGTGFGYIYIGIDVLYGLLLIVPLFLLVRLKNIY